MSNLQKLEPYLDLRTLAFAAFIGFGLCFGMWAGSQAGSGNYQSLAAVAGAAVCTAIAVYIDKNYWLLIPILTPFIGSIGVISIPFSYSELGVIAAAAGFLISCVFKRQRFHYQLRPLDIFLGVNLAWLVVAYLRNPIGILAFQTELIGGRSYFNILTWLAAYYLLAQNCVKGKMVGWFPWVIAVPMILAGSIGGITSVYPKVGSLIFPFYTAVNIDDLRSVSAEVNTSEARFTGLSEVAKPSILLLCAVYPALSLMTPLKTGRFLMFAACIVATGYSGFRTGYTTIAAYLGISAGLRRRWGDLLILGPVGIVALAFLGSMVSAGVHVPLQIQRALSFVPLIPWDSNAVLDAKSSTQWRVDMWKAAWEDPRIIRNKLLGDGFGYRAIDFQAMRDQEFGEGAGIEGASWEGHLLRGSFHSGPLSAIRVVGFVGLGLLTALMIWIAHYAVSLVRRTEGTPFHSWALFLALPLIFQVFEYYALFGDYRNNMVISMSGLGMLKLLDNSLEAWRKESKEPVISEKEVFSPAFGRSAPRPELQEASSPARRTRG